MSFRRGRVLECGRATLVALAVVSALTGGCSFGMNVAPIDPQQRTHKAARDCSGIMAPLADTVSAGFGAYNTYVSANAEQDVAAYGVIPMKKQTGLVLGITQLSLFGAAAVYGYVQTVRCGALRREKGVGMRSPRDGLEAQEWDAGRSRSRAKRPLAVAESAEPPENGPDVDEGGGEPPAGSTELPSWSAFRRYPIEAQPRVPEQK